MCQLWSFSVFFVLVNIWPVRFCFVICAIVIFRCQVKFVNPLLRSPIVGDAAFRTMIMLAKCSVAPLNNWALDLATALRLIATEESHRLCNIIPSDGDRVPKGGLFLGLFERIIMGLSVSCKTGPLPVDSFTFVFPVTSLISIRISRLIF